MNLYIRLENGQPVDHPILLENLLAAYPEIDPNNIPGVFVKFERIPAPELGIYEVNEGSTNQWVDGIVKDVWHIRPMTPEEKTTAQNLINDQWALNGYPSWIFDEELCAFEAPKPRPDKHDDIIYIWDEDSLDWVSVESE